MSSTQNAPTLVFFLHFLGGSAGEWAKQSAALPPTCEGVAIDLPGFGGAASVAGYDVAQMADHVVEAIRSRAPDRFALVGHSMGAKVATVVARRAEDGAAGLAGLSHLVLVAGSPPGPEPMEDAKRETMLAWFQEDAATSRQQAEAFIDANTHVPLPDEMREAAIGDVLRAHRDAWTAWLTNGSREDWGARVGRLATPTLVIAGDKDAALGPESQRQAMLPHFHDVTVEVVAEGAHLLPMEHPERVASLIAAHLDLRAPRLPAPYRALIHSSRVGENTRRILLERLAPPTETSVLSARATAVLRAAAARVIPQSATRPIDLGATVGTVLSEARGDGWRYAALPPDLEAAERGAATLDAAAGPPGFAGLLPGEQDALLERAAQGQLAASPGDGLNAAQMKLWFADLRSALTRAYVSHPATLARIGYSGIANGGDGPRKWSRTLIQAGEAEPWEPVAEPA